MCLGIPGKVMEIRDDGGLAMGKVDFGGVRKDACLAYLPEIEVGRLRHRPRRLRDQPGGRGGGAQDARDPGRDGRPGARADDHGPGHGTSRRSCRTTRPARSP